MRLSGVLALLSLFACSSADSDDVGPIKAGSSSRRSEPSRSDDADASDTHSTDPVAPPVTTGGEATTFVGTLDATPTTRFGGSPYCFYDVTLKSVQIEVAALPTGDIISATVKDTAIEAVVTPCTLTPAPPSDQSFAFTTATKTDDGYDLAFDGNAANHPATKLVLHLVKSGGSYTAAANWHRTDQGAPLAWTVTTSITLGPR